MSKRQKPKWTIMVYLAGDNDLTSHCVTVLQQLESVRYRNDVCVLACFESSTPWPRGSRYLEVNCSHSRARNKEVFFDWEMHNDLIPPDTNGDTDPHANGGSMNRPVVTEGLRKFINFGVSRHKDSEHFMLILFGHGPIVAGQTFLLSENPGSFLRLEDLKDVLNDHFGEDKRRLDILAFQNCVMNGIETAYEIRNHADFVIGSQGLVLATGWPYEKMIAAVGHSRSDASTSTVARKVLKVCARNMLDFTIMDRSSEQSACNLEALRGQSTITHALRSLVRALKDGLEIKVDRDDPGKEKRFLVYPEIADVIRLARLEAQSYWWEMFVDLYDFCERLIQGCNDLVKRQDRLLVNFGIEDADRSKLEKTELVRKTKAIVAGCIDVMKEIRELVPSSHSYYIGTELQYSHGLSIFFPWSFPVGPYFARPTRTSKEYRLETAFHTYSQYSFVKQSNWGEFLEVFFKATLRNMRRANRSFEMRTNLSNLESGLAFPHYDSPGQVITSDLQKSSPDTARADSDMSFNIKNYPRRHYLSPADDLRRIDQAGAVKAGEERFANPEAPPVSALGWNFPPLVAEVIKKPKSRRRRQTESVSSKAAAQKSSRNGENDSDANNVFTRVASQKSRRNGQNVGAGHPLAKVASSRNS